MHDNGVVCGTIKKMFYVKAISCVDFESISDNEKYYVSVNGRGIDFYNKERLFRTKAALLKSL